MPLSRRQFLAALSSTTFLVSARPAQAAVLPADTTPPRMVSFPQGLASGDPQASSIILWTRAEPATPGDVALQVQVSESDTFEELIVAEDVATGPDSDYTLRVQVSSLQPDRWYYYRFVTPAGDMSRLGRTRTAPAAGQARDLRLAFASCQSYEQSFYGTWARMVADDKAAPAAEQLDAVLHVGDFIYERSWHQRIEGGDQSRYVPPFPDGEMTDINRWAVSLADYRHLYKVYLADPHLQEARARWPFICTWDDHEFSNDNFQSFSRYGGEEKLEAQRRLDANQVWFEYIPAALDELEDQAAHGFRSADLDQGEAENNLAALNSLRIYRKLAWGDTVDLVITDLRSYRSAPCIPDDLPAALGMPLPSTPLVAIADAGRAYNDGVPPEFLPFGDSSFPNAARDREPGSCLGLEQRAWFLDTLENSTATWKAWGNSLPLIPINIDLSAVPFAGFDDSVLSVDAWAGYPFEVALLMRELRERKVGNVVSLSGDHHMHGAGSIRENAADAAAPDVIVDFNVAPMSSSPLFEDLLAAAIDQPEFLPLVQGEFDGRQQPMWHNTLLRGTLSSMAYDRTGLKTVSEWLGPNGANHGLRFVDTTNQGYGIAHFSAEAVAVQLIGVAQTRDDFEEPPPVLYRARFTTASWEGGESPQLRGPVFDGEAPFPFA